MPYLYPARIFSKLDFPAPEGPMMTVSSADLNCPQSPLKITFEPVTQR